MAMSPRLAELRDKQSAAGLTPGEKSELQTLENLSAVTVDAEGRHRVVDTEKLKQRIAGRENAEEVVKLCRELNPLARGPDWLRGFFETLTEYIQASYPVAGPQIPLPMTDREARQFGVKPMAFGKFAGREIGDVTRIYLDWLAGEQSQFSRELTRYLKNETVAEELRNEIEAEDYRYEDR
jgi:uncharacterized protein (DUF3820 family)